MDNEDADKQLPAKKLPTRLANMRMPWGWKLPALTQEGAKWLDDWFSRRSLSAAEATLRICGPGCTFHNQCPLVSLQIPLPLGCPCPVEAKVLDEFITEMRRSLGVEDDDAWGQMLVQYGAMWNLLLQRAMSEENSEMVVVESYRGVDKEGNALYELKVNPTLAFAKDVQRILQSIGKDLVATKEAKLRLSQAKAQAGPEEALRIIEAAFKVSDADVEVKTERIREKRKRPALEDPDRPSLPHVNTDGLKPDDDA